MNYQLLDSQKPSGCESDCVIVGVYEDATLSQAAKDLDDVSNGPISTVLDLGDFKGKSGQTHFLYAAQGVTASRILLVGCGKKDKFNLITFNKAVDSSTKSLKTANITSAISFLAEEVADSDAAVQQGIATHETAIYQCNDYKSKDIDEVVLKEFAFGFSGSVSESTKNSLNYGKAIASGMNLARDLANAPGNICTPTHLANQATELCDKYDSLSLEVLEESDMEELGMGAFLSVSKGSVEDGKMIIIQYSGADKAAAPIALVGKGITFDTGGISIKPSPAMDEMKYDMGGAASVIGTISACAEMNLPINVVGVVAAAENMPSSKASKPGDIVTSMSGQTIEVLNTDAEGRLVLCDALTYVSKYKPSAIIDIATLTGACIVALGHHISGLLTNNDDFAQEVLNAGKDAADEAWQLPLTDDYQGQLKSNFADIPNIGSDRSAGTITAACFLARFVKDQTWVHLDIAGTAWKSGAAKGATGRPVPLLSQLLINRSTAS